MSIKAYCVNAAVNIKPIYLNKHMFLCLFTIIVKKMFTQSETQKSLGSNEVHFFRVC